MRSSDPDFQRRATKRPEPVAAIPERKVNVGNLGAWMVKCNPDKWDFRGFRESGRTDIDDWSVVPSYRTELMAEGQTVLFWVTGSERSDLKPGLWGLGTVCGPIFRNQPGDEPGFWLDEEHRRRTKHFVHLDVDLFVEPVPRSLIQADPRLADLEVLRQPQMGNPLLVTTDELAALKEYIANVPKQVIVTPNGAGFGTPAKRAAVEAAAIETVTQEYRARRWKVRDVSRDCLGWDLTCSAPTGAVEHVEVKGVSGTAPTVLLTRNEARAANEDPTWRLAVVTSALTTPRIQIVDGTTAIARSQSFLIQVDLRTNFDG